MLKNHLLVALRGLRRHPGYALLNVAGLAVGVACCLFLLLFVQHERSYDRSYEDPEQVFRISATTGDREIALTPPHVAALLADEVPAVEAAARIYTYGSHALIQVGDETVEQDGFYYADASVFDVLTYPFLAGDPATALARPNTVVLTESVARRYFGDANPVGQTLLCNTDETLEVTGVIADVPDASHLRFELLASLPAWTEPEAVWSTANYHTYVRTRDAASAADLPRQLAALVDRLEAEGQEPWPLHAMPVTDLHLRSDIEYDLDSTGSIRVVYGFATVALLILLIACINYMNLATARAAERAEEVGLRKSLGARRGQLVGQFYLESALLTVGAVALAVMLVVLGMPAFNALSGKQLTAASLLDPGILALVVGLVVVVSLVAGSYPALHLSGFEPVRALRGGSRSGRGTAWLRRGLVVVQFGISAVLLAGTAVVLSQLRYLGDQDLGFDEAHVVALPLADKTLRESYPAMEEALRESPAVLAVGAVNQVPGELGWTSSLRREGMTDDDDAISTKGMPADASVVDGLGLRVVAGHAFPENPPAPEETNFQILLNETAARRLGWTPETAIGRTVTVDWRQGEVLGVVEDFHYKSLHEAIEPLAIWYDPGAVGALTVRLAPGATRAGMEHVEAVWGQFAPHRPLSYRFLDDVYDQLYQSDQRLGRVVSVFAFLALFVAGLGLFGLAAFTAQQRTKEIGVRKVLGATVPALVGLLTKDFVGLVAVAVLVAAPLAWLGASRWLSGFAYHVALGPVPFIVAGAVLLAVALATVSGQALRAASADPIRALRSE